jgi:hypothetical protein
MRRAALGAALALGYLASGDLAHATESSGSGHNYEYYIDSKSYCKDKFRWTYKKIYVGEGYYKVEFYSDAYSKSGKKFYPLDDIHFYYYKDGHYKKYYVIDEDDDHRYVWFKKDYYFYAYYEDEYCNDNYKGGVLRFIYQGSHP